MERKIVEVRGIKIGEGMPKIGVSIMGTCLPTLIKEITHLKTLKVDIVEWRLDYYDYVKDMQAVINTLITLRQHLGDMPLMITFRTLQEGGHKEISVETYSTLYKTIMKKQLVDLIDIEVFLNEAIVKDLIEFAHQHHVKVIGSNHEFNNTPSKEEIIRRLCKMQTLDVDIPKIAVMPHHAEDVLTLLSATYDMMMYHADRPIVTMSMSKMGLVSRLTGSLFGSAITFGANEKVSAPGQISADLLHQMLEVLN